MEQGILSILGDGVSAAAMAVMLYFVLQNKFKQDVAVHEAVNKLCSKIDLLLESNYKLQTDNALSSTQSSAVYAENKEHYAKISYKIDAIEKKTDDIILVSSRVYDKLSSNVKVGTVLIQKGFITQAQLDEALEEQKKYT